MVKYKAYNQHTNISMLQYANQLEYHTQINQCFRFRCLIHLPSCLHSDKFVFNQKIKTEEKEEREKTKTEHQQKRLWICVVY